MTIRLGDEVAAAIDRGDAVVALESTVYSTLGLPAPANREALERCLVAVREAGAVPAVTAIVDGEAMVGLSADEHDRVLTGSRKVAERDLAVAIAQRWPLGVTTVSASLALADAVGIEVFATGGIGGVHRDAEITGDVSADLDAIGRGPGDHGLRRGQGVPRSGPNARAPRDDRRPGARVPHRPIPRLLRARQRLAGPPTGSTRRARWRPVLRARRMLARRTVGVLVANPIPPAAELDAGAIDAEITAALGAAADAGLRGPAVTPFVLDRLAAETDGRSIPANLALVEHNCRVAATIATELAR